jgi:ATP-dependent helicase/nuclease subunit B
MVEILGDEKPELAEFTDIYTAGLSDVEVGVIPDAADGLNLGTMIRTRPRPVRAAVILGANEGTLPMQPKTEGLFSVDEKDFFKSKGFALGSLDDIRMNEENAAMYRMMSKPSEKIYISYSLTGTDGKDASPSPVIDALKSLFPAIEKQGLIKRDLISEGFGMDMVNTPSDALRHLSVHMDEKGEGAQKEDLTRAMLKWYRDNMRSDLETMLDAAAYDNNPTPLGRAVSSGLFARGSNLTLSASALGTYFDCPFKYFVSYGLSPYEERDFATDPRSVGDAYHECLMAVAERLVDDRALLKAIDGGDKDALTNMVNEELDRLADEYRGGLFISTGAERYRMERIREICASAASAMAEQLAAESITGAELEEAFGRSGKTEGIKLKVGDDEVYVEGKIDRSDFMNIGGGKRVRIIDYKTGSDKLDLWKMRQGYHMQLMIYLISATSGEYEPAGMFYFNIKDPIEAANNFSDAKLAALMEKEASDSFKLKGAYINEEGVLGAMPKEALAKGEKESPISREEYEEIKHDVESKIEEIASGILSGKIDIHPLKGDSNTLACNYCDYKSVCRRDACYGLNYSRKLEPKPKKTNCSASENGDEKHLSKV